MPKSRLLTLLLMAVACVGCEKKPPAQPTPSSAAPKQQAAVKLTVLVVDDSPLASGLKLLRGEWAERSGGELDIQEWTGEQLLAATELDVDVVIYPSRYVGSLVARETLRSVRSTVLESEDVAFDQLFPLVRNRALRYGGEIHALSLGEPPLMLVSSIESQASTTWENLQLQTTIDGQLKFPQATQLLARAIALGVNRGQIIRLFDAESMQPSIATPPFIRALEQIVQNKQSSAAEQHFIGHLGWPSVIGDEAPETRYCWPLPPAAQSYDSLREAWEPVDVQQPPVLLGFAGRSVSVTRATRNSASAFKLLAWVVSDSVALQLSPRSTATVWFRRSQTEQASKWAADAESSSHVVQLLSADDCFLLPRIPGIDEYLQALDEAVVALSTSGGSAADVLAEVTKRWNSLTDRYGRDRQRAAYRKHLGLDGP